MNQVAYKDPFIRKLIRNKGAFFGLVVIAFSFFLSLFGYILAIDTSSNANRMLVEIGGKPPGFKINLLKIPNRDFSDKQSFLDVLINGENEHYLYVPINNFEKRGDSIFAEKYVDDDTSIHQAYSYAALNKNEDADYVPVKHYIAYLGTDKYGRDLLSRLLIGVRVSLGVGAVSVIISLTLGLLLGAFAGYFRGKTDLIIMWFINIIWSIPTLLLVFAFTLLLGKGFWQVLIAIGLTMWVNVARVVRGQVLSIRELEYVEAAKVLGYSPFRIIVKHIIPNIMGPVWVVVASNFASAIVIEAGLSFLGIGVQPPQSSWGLMIKENYNFIITNNPMLAIIPGIAIMLLVLAFNLLGNGLRDALDVKET
jgi:peptide/nickel transport system permease protein